MHYRERIKPRSQVVHHNARAFGQPLQSPNWKRLPNIEDTEEYKGREKAFPGQRDGDERNQLSGNFINDDKLRVFRLVVASDPRGGWDSDEGHNRSRDNRSPGATRSRDPGTCQRPKHNGG